MSYYAVPEIGNRYNKLVVLARCSPDGVKARWICQCDCGNFATALGVQLRNGQKASCGCIQSDRRKSGWNKSHGMCTTPIYRTWSGMFQRCRNPKSKSYPDYGGRGIKVCDRWSLFLNFLQDMGNRPVGCTLDRIDPNGDYEPRNCRWSSQQVQCQNRRKYSVIEKFTDGELIAEIRRRYPESLITIGKIKLQPPMIAEQATA